MKFRPSSHSDDWTVIGEYSAEAAAVKAEAYLNALLARVKNGEVHVDWKADAAQISRRGKHVEFKAHTCGYVDVVESVLSSQPHEKVDSFADYQVVHLEVKIPNGSAKNGYLSVLLLILDSRELCVIQYLVFLCGKPTVTANDEHDVLQWRYEGDEIYSKNENALQLNGKFPLKDHKNWAARVE
jgi:hypothetical protein